MKLRYLKKLDSSIVLQFEDNTGWHDVDSTTEASEHKRREYAAIAVKLGTTPAKVEEVAQAIENLQPLPGSKVQR